MFNLVVATTQNVFISIEPTALFDKVPPLLLITYYLLLDPSPDTRQPL